MMQFRVLVKAERQIKFHHSRRWYSYIYIYTYTYTYTEANIEKDENFKGEMFYIAKNLSVAIFQTIHESEWWIWTVPCFTSRFRFICRFL